MSEEQNYDKECVALIKAMNLLPGVITISSCCGHYKHPFRVFFGADSLEALPRLCYWFDCCHCGRAGWNIIAHTDCGMRPISFFAEGPVGADAYAGAEEIAALIVRDMEDNPAQSAYCT